MYNSYESIVTFYNLVHVPQPSKVRIKIVCKINLKQLIIQGKHANFAEEV